MENCNILIIRIPERCEGCPYLVYERIDHNYYGESSEHRHCRLFNQPLMSDGTACPMCLEAVESSNQELSDLHSTFLEASQQRTYQEITNLVNRLDTKFKELGDIGESIMKVVREMSKDVCSN